MDNRIVELNENMNHVLQGHQDEQVIVEMKKRGPL